ncbi:MAG: hypothetical protein IJE05_04485 [Clostridia bacterium]|nr:hypothetical protein [Clostridia bacterium]
MKKSANSNVEKFHGMKVVSDYDPLSVKGEYVIEINSNQDLVCRYYDENGQADDNSTELDYIVRPNCTEANVTGKLKRQIGLSGVLISESAVSLIKTYVKSVSTSTSI